MQDQETQQALAARIAQEGLSVRAAEALVRENGTRQPKPPRKEPPVRNADLAAAEAHLRERLGTRISIQGDENKGKVIIEYFNAETLQAIYDALGGEGR